MLDQKMQLAQNSKCLNILIFNKSITQNIHIINQLIPNVMINILNIIIQNKNIQKMRPFGVASQYNKSNQQSKYIQFSISHPQPVNPQTIVKMPKIYARRQEPRIHTINHNKLQTYARPVSNPVINQPPPINIRQDVVINPMPNTVPQIMSNISQQPQKIHVFDKKTHAFTRPIKQNQVPIVPVPLSNNLPTNLTNSQNINNLHQQPIIVQQMSSNNIQIPSQQQPQYIHIVNKQNNLFVRSKPPPLQPSPQVIQPFLIPMPLIKQQQVPTIHQQEYVRQAVMLDEQGQVLDCTPHLRYHRVFRHQQEILPQMQQQQQKQVQIQHIIPALLIGSQHVDMQQSEYSGISQPQISRKISHKRSYHAQDYYHQQNQAIKPNNTLQPTIISIYKHEQQQEYSPVGKKIIKYQPIQPILVQPDSINTMVAMPQQPVIEMNDDIQVVQFPSIAPIVF